MLHLGAGLVSHPVTTLVAAFAKAKFTNHFAQCGVTNVYANLFGKLLVYPLNPAVALFVKPADKIRVDNNLIGSYRFGHFTALGNNAHHRRGADVHMPRNFSYTHALFVKKINRFTLVRFDHEIALSLG